MPENLSLSNSSSAKADTKNTVSASGGETGTSGGVVNNYSFGSSSLSASTGSLAGSAKSVWVWLLGGLAAVGAIWWIWKGRKR